MSTTNQYEVPFVFLSFAITIVYITLLFVYIFRYRIFKKSIPIEIDSQGNFFNYNRILPKYDQYYKLNRFLYRLKMIKKRMNE